MRKCPNCGYQLSARKTREKTKQTFFRKDHEYLMGWQDKLRRRLEIYRNAGGEAEWFDESDPNSIEDHKPATCQGCTEPHLIGWAEGEWHHNVKSHGGKRCDCAACGLFVCVPWHRAFHNRVIGARQIT